MIDLLYGRVFSNTLEEKIYNTYSKVNIYIFISKIVSIYYK